MFIFLEQAQVFLRSICLVRLKFAIIFLWKRISEAFRFKSSEKYRQNLVVYELYISIGLKKVISIELYLSPTYCSPFMQPV